MVDTDDVVDCRDESRSCSAVFGRRAALKIVDTDDVVDGREGSCSCFALFPG